MAAVQHSPRVTVAEYVAMEEASAERLELDDGVVRAMAGASLNHERICINVGSGLLTRLAGKPCDVFNSGAKLAVRESDSFFYPDVMVVCGEIVRHDELKESVANPVVVIEVVSPSTERLDRGRKMHVYRSIPELKVYAIVAQDYAQIDVYRRMDDGGWRIDSVDGLDATLKLDPIGVEIAMAEIYARVEFPTLPEPAPEEETA